MSERHHEQTLNQIYQHPISLNLEWKKVQHLIEHLGGTVEETKHGRIKIELKGKITSVAKPKTKDLSDREEVVTIRHFLDSCGVKPGSQTTDTASAG